MTFWASCNATFPLILTALPFQLSHHPVPFQLVRANWFEQIGANSMSYRWRVAAAKADGEICCSRRRVTVHMSAITSNLVSQGLSPNTPTGSSPNRSE